MRKSCKLELLLRELEIFARHLNIGASKKKTPQKNLRTRRRNAKH